MVNITDKLQCAGCTACEQICGHKAIKMKPDAEGFLYPSVDNSLCVDCGLCETVCPILHFEITVNDLSCQSIYCVTNKDEDILSESASGGAFSALALYVLEQKGVVCAVSYSDDMVARHTIIDTKEELYKLRNSKYVQSYLGDIFSLLRNELKTGRMVMFVGTPCQVAGLKRYLCVPYPNLLLVDIACHSVASPLVFKDYVDYVQKKVGRKITGINLRDKSLGWGNYSSVMTFTKGYVLKNHYWAGVWARAYGNLLIARPSCYSCKFCSFKRCGDITIGDYWGVERHYPSMNDSKGVSILMANTNLGSDIFERVKTSFKYLQTERKKSSQPCFVSPNSVPAERETFWVDYARGAFPYVCKKYWGYDFTRKIKLLILSFLSSLRQ